MGYFSEDGRGVPVNVSGTHSAWQPERAAAAVQMLMYSWDRTCRHVPHRTASPECTRQHLHSLHCMLWLISTALPAIAEAVHSVHHCDVAAETLLV
jgi:hypothetical protein